MALCLVFFVLEADASPYQALVPSYPTCSDSLIRMEGKGISLLCDAANRSSLQQCISVQQEVRAHWHSYTSILLNTVCREDARVLESVTRFVRDVQRYSFLGYKDVVSFVPLSRECLQARVALSGTRIERFVVRRAREK